MDGSLEALLGAAEQSGGELSLRAWRDLAEAYWIRRALQQSRGNRSAAARALRIGRRTLYSKMERLGHALDRHPAGAPRDPSEVCDGTDGAG